MFTKLASSQIRRRRSWSAATFGTSAVVHGLVLGGVVYASVIAPVTAEDDSVERVTYVDFEEPAPPPPPPPPPPVNLPDAPMAPPTPLGFQELVLPDVIPVEIPEVDLSMPAISAADFSGIGVRGGRADGDSTVTSAPADIAAGPTFTPFEVIPEVRNRAEVARALQRAYPPLLRSARVGGTAVVWFFINTQGVVERSLVSRTSGYDQLDQAALDVASVFEFTPAMNRDERVSVWIEIPIVFQIDR